MIEIDPLFLTYVSLVRFGIILFPELSALWQLAPQPIREAVPFRQVLLDLQQRVRDLEIDAGCLLADPHFQAAVQLLVDPPKLPWVDKLGNRIDPGSEHCKSLSYIPLQVSAQPTDWLLTKLKIPFTLHSFQPHITVEQDEKGDWFTAYRSGLALNLGDIEVPMRVNTCHDYTDKSLHYYFDLKQQQEDIAQQLAATLRGFESQLIEEASCLCCYGLQIFSLAAKLQAFLQQFQEFHKDKDLLEV